jgi:hypothetical protein
MNPASSVRDRGTPSVKARGRSWRPRRRRRCWMQSAYRRWPDCAIGPGLGSWSIALRGWVPRWPCPSKMSTCRAAHLDLAYEEGGQVHEMSCDPNLDEYLHAYIDQAHLVDGKAWLFRWQSPERAVSENPVRQADVCRTIARRALAVKVRTRIGCPSQWDYRVPRNGGKLELAQQMAIMRARGPREERSALPAGRTSRRVPGARTRAVACAAPWHKFCCSDKPDVATCRARKYLLDLRTGEPIQAGEESAEHAAVLVQHGVVAVLK